MGDGAVRRVNQRHIFGLPMYRLSRPLLRAVPSLPRILLFNSSANTDNATYAGSAVHWSAVASASGVNASANAGTYNYPVYLHKGSRVVSRNANLWNSTTFDNNIGYMLIGSGAPDDNIWTGSQSDGTGFGSQTLGSAKPRVGRDDYVDSHWIDWKGNQNLFPNTRNLPLYGISDVLTVPSAVPEIDPAMGANALSLIAGVLAMFEQRRRRSGRPGRSRLGLPSDLAPTKPATNTIATAKVRDSNGPVSLRLRAMQPQPRPGLASSRLYQRQPTVESWSLSLSEVEARLVRVVHTWPDATGNLAAAQALNPPTRSRVSLRPSFCKTLAAIAER